MNGIKISFVVLFNVVCSSILVIGAEQLSTDIDYGKNTQEMILQHHYPCENYTIQTEDGYLLTLFRIPGKRYEKLEDAKKVPKQPVILQHGLIDSSDCWVLNEKPALAYMLADSGFDVWLGNFRGSKYSRAHIKLDPDKDEKEFFSYSIDEVIKYDLKAYFTEIPKITGYQKISYVGHSMGGGSILAAASSEPAFYSEHLRSCVGLTPSTRNLNSNHLLRLARSIKVLDGMEFFNLWEIFNLHDLAHQAFSMFCHNVPSVCSFFLKMLADKQPEHDNADKYGVFFNHYPDATSTHQMRHILQQTKHTGYMHYQKNEDDPLEEYDLTKFPSNVPAAVFGGLADLFVSVIDTQWVKSKLEIAGAMKMYREYEGYGHLTFLLPKKNFACYEDTLMFLKSEAY